MKDESYYRDLEDQYVSVYEIEVPEGSVISGTAQVHVKISPKDAEIDNLIVTALLMDEMKDGSAFEAYQVISENRYRVPLKTMDTYEIGEGHEDGKVQEFVKSYTYCHAITYGYMDLLDPEAEKNPTLDTKYHTAKAGEYSDYTLVFTPTEYTVQKGHVLKLYIFAQDPDRAKSDISKPNYLAADKVDEIYSFTIDNTSVEVKLPIKK